MTFNRLLYLSAHVHAAQGNAVERLKSFGMLTCPDAYFKKRKSYREADGIKFPPFLNMRDTKDIMRWNRTRELLLKISNSHDKQRHDIHLSLVIASALVMCCLVVAARLLPSYSIPIPSGTPSYLLPLLLFDVSVLSVLITLTLVKAAEAYRIQ